MTKEYFDTHTFDEIMTLLLSESDIFVDYEQMKDYLNYAVDNEHWYLADHILQSLREDAFAQYWEYDISMGTLETPIAITSKSDIEERGYEFDD